MLLLLEQVGTQRCCRRLSTWGWVGRSAEVVGLKLLLAQLFSVLPIRFCSEDTSMSLQVCFRNFLDGRHT